MQSGGSYYARYTGPIDEVVTESRTLEVPSERKCVRYDIGNYDWKVSFCGPTFTMFSDSLNKSISDKTIKSAKSNNTHLSSKQFVQQTLKKFKEIII